MNEKNFNQASSSKYYSDLKNNNNFEFNKVNIYNFSFIFSIKKHPIPIVNNDNLSRKLNYFETNLNHNNELGVAPFHTISTNNIENVSYNNPNNFPQNNGREFSPQKFNNNNNRYLNGIFLKYLNTKIYV